MELDWIGAFSLSILDEHLHDIPWNWTELEHSLSILDEHLHDILWNWTELEHSLSILDEHMHIPTKPGLDQ